MERINVPLEVFVDSIENTKDLYFVVETKSEQQTLRPQTYLQLKAANKDDMFKKLIDRDELYRTHFIEHPSTVSFIHGSIAGFSTLFDYTRLFNSDYYTYYFKLTLQEISKCLFSITDNTGEIKSIHKGITGAVSVLKEWNTHRKTYKVQEDKNGNIISHPQVNVVIPFKVKPLYCLPPFDQRKYYHGSTKKLDSLKAWTYVTPYREDAVSFAVPWSSEDLIYDEHEISEVDGRPPHNLAFRTSVKKPNDRKLYVYEVEGVQTIGAKTNTGKEYPWNRVLVKENKEFKLEVINSWKTHFKLK